MNEQNDISTNVGTEQDQKDKIFDDLRDLLDKAQQMIYQAQAIVFEGKHRK
jgi:hypothetical protein